MANPLKNYLSGLWAASVELNTRNIESLARKATMGRSAIQFCDLGCGDGVLTERVARCIGAATVAVVETFDPQIAAAERRGFEVIKDDLNGRLSLPSDRFDAGRQTR